MMAEEQPYQKLNVNTVITKRTVSFRRIDFMIHDIDRLELVLTGFAKGESLAENSDEKKYTWSYMTTMFLCLIDAGIPFHKDVYKLKARLNLMRAKHEHRFFNPDETYFIPSLFEDIIKNSSSTREDDYMLMIPACALALTSLDTDAVLKNILYFSQMYDVQTTISCAIIVYIIQGVLNDIPLEDVIHNMNTDLQQFNIDPFDELFNETIYKNDKNELGVTNSLKSVIKTGIWCAENANTPTDAFNNVYAFSELLEEDAYIVLSCFVGILENAIEQKCIPYGKFKNGRVLKRIAEGICEFNKKTNP